ncbi:MAG: TonB-dependent receptor [Rhodanobacter sp.]
MGKLRIRTMVLAITAAMATGWCVAAVAQGHTAAPTKTASDSTQPTPAAQKPPAATVTNLDAMTVVGTRRTGQSSQTDSTVPVDILPMDTAATQGAQQGLTETLSYKVPSFISGTQSGADNSDSEDTPALRGLGSDQTLVLVNGKRLHQTALINLFGARNRGNTGTDLNTIPLLAIANVQVLRDGAAAQYGSDAIGGVINVVLKRKKGCEVVGGYNQYTRGDGKDYLAAAYCGFGVGDGGVISITAQHRSNGRSDRTSATLDPLRTIGDASVKEGTIYLNGDIPFGSTAHFYFDGGMQNRAVSSAAFARGGIGSDDIPSRNSATMYPDGFVPFIEPYIQDRHATAGVWWMWNNWRVDASQTAGYNRLMDTVSHTLNASIANLDLEQGGTGISPSRFGAGGFSFAQQTTNLDTTRFFADWLSGVNVAFGTEFRHETYRIYAGEPSSYNDVDGTSGGNAGSQGFPGFQPSDATNKSRQSWAAYADIESDWTDRFISDQAIRHEHFSDFGSTTIGKISASFRATDDFLLRGSVSSGFRAPSLQQRYFSSTFSDFVSGVQTNIVIAPNGSPLANAAGIPSLKQEESTSGTLGFTWTPLKDLSLTLDGYRIDIDNRIVLSGTFDDSDPNIGATIARLGVGEAQFFVNSVDTRTTGVDLTVNYGIDLGGGHLNNFFAFNHGETTIRKVHTPASLTGREDSLLGPRDALFLTNGAPHDKAILGFNHGINKWNSDLKLIYFGPMTLGTFSGPPTPNAHYAGKMSANVSVTYSFTPKTKVTIGGTNILDKFPSRQNPDETDNGFRYDSVQFGLNGAAWFARVAHQF